MDPSRLIHNARLQRFVAARRSRWAKVLVGSAGGAAFGVMVLVTVVRDAGRIDVPVAGIVILGAAVLGAVAGYLLGLYDGFRERSADPEAPAPGTLARILFGGGLWSLLLVWVPLVFVVSMVAIIGGFTLFR